MKLASQIKPISYLKAHAAEVVRQRNEQKQSMIITQNGEAKIVVQDIEGYELTKETLALLKILALGDREIGQGKVTSAESAIRHVRQRRKRRT